MKTYPRMTPTLMKIALPFYLIVGVAVLAVGSARGVEIAHPLSVSPKAHAVESSIQIMEQAPVLEIVKKIVISKG